MFNKFMEESPVLDYSRAPSFFIDKMCYLWQKNLILQPFFSAST